MTADEKSELEGMRNDLALFKLDVIERLHSVALQVERLCATTRLEIDQLKHQCDERHTSNVQRIDSLASDERKASGFIERLKGMALPVAICLSVVALVLNIFM